MIKENELMHYGVPGMKWGKRRYQNPDGSLTLAGQKRISKQYKKMANKVSNSLSRNYSSMRVKSYNKAADYMNGGGIDKFNKQQEKKYGKNYAKRDGYVNDYRKLFDKKLTEEMNKTLDNFYATDKNVKKARNLVEKYGMTKWDDLAKENEAAIEDVRKTVEKYH